MAISAAGPRATTDGSQTGIVDTSLSVSHGDLLKYDVTKQMYVPINAAALPLSSFDNDLGVISLADINLSSLDGSNIDLVSYIKTTEVMALLDAYVPPLVDYVNILNTPSLTQYATSEYVDQMVTSVSSSTSFSGNYSDLVGAPDPATVVLPKGTTAQRPVAPVEAQMFFNTDTKMFEGYDGTSWIQLLPSMLGSYPL